MHRSNGRLIKISLPFLSALLVVGAAVAESPAKQVPWSVEIVELLASYRTQLAAVDHNTREGRERFAALRDELGARLSEQIPTVPLAKGQGDCNTACSLAQTGKASATMAKMHADAAAMSSDPGCNSVHTGDAQQQAAAAVFYANTAAVYACQGPKSAQTAEDLLEDAESRARNAWTSAWSSYTAGCSTSFDTAVDASNATVELHNAAYYATNCS